MANVVDPQSLGHLSTCAVYVDKILNMKTACWERPSSESGITGVIPRLDEA
jgi:hypothetical protein